MNTVERILCAAIWYKDLELKKDIPIKFYLPVNIEKGVVFCGHRHVQCLYTKHVITGLRDAESGEHEQGFLTSNNRFVDRREAFKIAYKANQIIGSIIDELHKDEVFKLIDENQCSKELYSEDLY